MDLYAQLKKVIDDLKSEYGLAKSDGKVDMRELAQLCIHAAFAVSAIIAQGAVEATAIQKAADQLYTELLEPVLRNQLVNVTASLTGWKRWLADFLVDKAIPFALAAGKSKWMSFVSGLIEASLPLAEAQAFHDSQGAVTTPSREQLETRREQRRQARQARRAGAGFGSAG